MARLEASAVAFSLLLLTEAAVAQQVYSREPSKGQIRSGQTVLVDDGRCPRGQILEVSGGTNPGLRGQHGRSTERTRRCVPRP
ncbi:DUF6719 family protein [Bosea sp. NPDC055332]